MRTDYVPGDGLAVVAAGTAVLLPTGCPPDMLEALWGSVHGHGSLTDHLEVLLAPGLSAAPSFALVRLADGVAHVVARGVARVEVSTSDGERLVEASHVSTWSEQTIAGVSAALLVGPAALPGAALPGAALPVAAAVLRADAVRMSTTGPGTAEGRATGSAARGPVAADEPVDDVPVDWPTPAPVAEPQRAVPQAGPGEPPPVSAAVPVVAEPVLRAPVPVVDDDDDDAVAVPAWEPIRTPGGQPPRANEPLAVPVQVEPVPTPEDHDGLTVMSSDMVALRRELPEWAGDAVPQLAVPTPRNPAPAKLLMSTGLVVSLNRPVLLGRAPQVTRVANNEIPRLITVSSPNQDISRTHAEVRMDGEVVVVTDLRSTNGVLLLRQGQGTQRLHPGEPTVVEPGVVVDLGEGVTFLVEEGG